MCWSCRDQLHHVDTFDPVISVHFRHWRRNTKSHSPISAKYLMCHSSDYQDSRDGGEAWMARPFQVTWDRVRRVQLPH